MDISDFFWNFIDYHLQIYKSPSNFEMQIFNHIYKGDTIINIRTLCTTEQCEYNYFESFDELIYTAIRICTGEQLNKIKTFINKLNIEEELSERLKGLESF